MMLFLYLHFINMVYSKIKLHNQAFHKYNVLQKKLCILNYINIKIIYNKIIYNKQYN